MAFTIGIIDDYRNILVMNWSDQARVVIHAIITNVIYQDWIARNKAIFDDHIQSWKHCVTLIKAHAKIVGNSTLRASNGTMANFSFLKHLGITVRLGKNIQTLDVLWSSPLLGWMKVNVDGASKGNTRLAGCGGIFRDSFANHIVNFSSFLGNEDSDFGEVFAIIIALELAMEKNFDKVWIETIVFFL